MRELNATEMEIMHKSLLSSVKIKKGVMRDGGFPSTFSPSLPTRNDGESIADMLERLGFSGPPDSRDSSAFANIEQVVMIDPTDV